MQRLPRRKSELENFFSMFGGGDKEEAKAEALKSELGPLYPAYAQYQLLMQMRGVQARLPYEIDIK